MSPYVGPEGVNLKAPALPPTRPAAAPSGVLSVWVGGSPIAQGSKSARALADGRVVMWERTGAELGPWRAAIALLARAAWRGRAPMRGPVSISLVFRLPKPKSNRDPMPVGARTGDIEKLTRAVHDALAAGTGAGVFANDSQVCDATLRKRWATPDHPAGVHIRAWEELSA